MILLFHHCPGYFALLGYKQHVSPLAPEPLVICSVQTPWWTLGGHNEKEGEAPSLHLSTSPTLINTGTRPQKKSSVFSKTSRKTFNHLSGYLSQGSIMVQECSVPPSHPHPAKLRSETFSFFHTRLKVAGHCVKSFLFTWSSLSDCPSLARGWVTLEHLFSCFWALISNPWTIPLVLL